MIEYGPIDKAAITAHRIDSLMNSGASTPRTGQTLVAGGHRWGVGDTLTEAKANFRRQGGRLCDGYEVVVFDADTRFHGVDQAGRFHYRGNAPTRTEVKARKR